MVGVVHLDSGGTFNLVSRLLEREFRERGGIWATHKGNTFVVGVVQKREVTEVTKITTMTNTKTITESEARILIFLDNVSDRYKYPTHISAKLRLDYSYTVRMLRAMEVQGWVRGTKREQKTFYELMEEVPLQEAVSITMAQTLTEENTPFNELGRKGSTVLPTEGKRSSLSPNPIKYSTSMHPEQTNLYTPTTEETIQRGEITT